MAAAITRPVPDRSGRRRRWAGDVGRKATRLMAATVGGGSGCLHFLTNVATFPTFTDMPEAIDHADGAIFCAGAYEVPRIGA
jgi:hypothetical protein